MAEEVRDLHAVDGQAADGGDHDEVVAGEHELLREFAQPVVVSDAQDAHQLVRPGFGQKLAHGGGERGGDEDPFFAERNEAFAGVGADHGDGLVAQQGFAGEGGGGFFNVVGVADQHVRLGEQAGAQQVGADGQAGERQEDEHEAPGDAGPEARERPLGEVHDHGVEQRGDHDDADHLARFVPPGLRRWAV
ncbi:hypothetical protein Y695_04181 [Hydrogenophaga sp. T4]|nr:hypothetical protein Y695_04181 [Hydrogenophaga sp. T4]